MSQAFCKYAPPHPAWLCRGHLEAGPTLPRASSPQGSPGWMLRLSGSRQGRCTLFRWKVNSQQDGSKTMTSWDSGDRNKEGPQDWLGAHDGFTKKKKRSDTRVQLRMELQRPLLQVADRPEVIPDLARSSKPMLSSTVWRAREPQAEVDTIPTFWLSAFEASSMACQAQRA